MICTRCEIEYSGKRSKFCSFECSRLYYKAQYRQRNKDKIHAYKKDRRAKGLEKISLTRPSVLFKEIIKGKECRACHTKENLTVNHIVPLSIGGGHEEKNIEILCVSCNSKEYHILVKQALSLYFKKYLQEKSASPLS